MELATNECGVGEPLEGAGRESLFSVGHSYSWLVLHVKSRQEKALAQDLAARGIQFYLPLTVQRRLHAGRKVLVEVPLFAGYLFLRGSLDDAYNADRTRRVAGIIRVADQARLNAELLSLDVAIRSGVPLVSHPWLRTGVRVEIVVGPLRGLKGLVQDRQSLERVVLQVNMLGQAVSIEVNADDVAPLE